jgi:predicted PurR-regulated permease PerM
MSGVTMSALARIIGMIAGAAPFIAVVCLDKSGSWGAGTALWGLAVIILVGTEIKPK